VIRSSVSIAAVVIVLAGALLAVLANPVICQPSACPGGGTCDRVCSSILAPHLLIILAAALASVGLWQLRRRFPR
jgi:Na+-transporting NADH:ubiquinone oxidoreductase subunit NqrF